MKVAKSSESGEPREGSAKLFYRPNGVMARWQDYYTTRTLFVLAILVAQIL
jgi:hypothetical protein